MTLSLKGLDAERVCVEVLRQLGGQLPQDVAIRVSKGRMGTRRGPQPMRTFRPGDPGFEEAHRRLGKHSPPPDREIHQKTLGSASGTWAIFGFGTWLPFIPRRLAIKLAYIDVVETVQELVSDDTGDPWPGENFKVRAALEGDAVRLWFENKGGTTVPGVTLPLSLATQEP